MQNRLQDLVSEVNKNDIKQRMWGEDLFFKVTAAAPPPFSQALTLQMSLKAQM